MYQKPDEKIREKANRESLDSLTGVLKKNVAEEQIASNMREKQGGALFLCGVNYIKRVNEQYGYLAGDECLKQTARILSYMIRPNDILGRWSGDEFVIFMPDCQDIQQAEEYARRINNRFCASGKKGKKKIPHSLTIIWVLRERTDICRTLFARADAEMMRRRAALETAEGRDRKGREHYSKDISQVRKELLEQIKKPGAYCQDYETFKGIYRFLARGLIRSGQKACVILITVVNEDGGSPLLYEKDALMEQLGKNIADTIRLGDVYTRYSSSQYLLLVIDTTQRQTDLIVDRIREQFLAGKYNNNILIHRCYELQPTQIGEVDGAGCETIAGR